MEVPVEFVYQVVGQQAVEIAWLRREVARREAELARLAAVERAVAELTAEREAGVSPEPGP